MTQQSKLTLSPLLLTVHLGHSAAERELAQTVTADITLKFSILPDACMSDKLSDTICYHTLANTLQAYCQHHPCQLIEALTWQLYQVTKAFSPQITDVAITLSKHPPTTHLKGCQFTISDWG